MSIIIISDIIILREMRQQTKCFETAGSDRHLKWNSAGSRSITIRVIAVSLIYCITVGPGGISFLIPGVIENVWVVSFFDLIWYVNYGCNFVLYSFIGTEFRRDFRSLFCRRRRPVAYYGQQSASSDKNGKYNRLGFQFEINT